MFYNENVLFLSAFGQPCNLNFAGTAVEKDFEWGIIERNDASKAIVFPWTSATPLSGELLQASLDGLLQNDLNLVSAYPYSYFGIGTNHAYLEEVPQTTNNPVVLPEIVNKVQYCYAGAGQANKYQQYKEGSIDSTRDVAWENSVTLKATVSNMGTEQSAFILGSTVPAHPFREGRAWNYGLFGVKKGSPTWYDVDIENLVKADNGITINYYGNYFVYPYSQTRDICLSTNTDIYSDHTSEYFKKIYEALPVYTYVLSGDFKKGDVIDLSYNGNHGIVYEKSYNGATKYSAFDGSNDTIISVDLLSANNRIQRTIDYCDLVYITRETKRPAGSTEDTYDSTLKAIITFKADINSGAIGVRTERTYSPAAEARIERLLYETSQGQTLSPNDVKCSYLLNYKKADSVISLAGNNNTPCYVLEQYK